MAAFFAAPTAHYITRAACELLSLFPRIGRERALLRLAQSRPAGSKTMDARMPPLFFQGK